MTQLKTKSGKELFEAEVLVEGVTLHKEDGVVVAKLDGETVGTVASETVILDGKEVKISSLVGEIDPTTLIGKDPTTLSQEELIALTTYLQQLATGAAPKASTKPADKGTNKAPAKTAPKAKKAVEEDEDEDEDEFELPEGLDTYEAIASLGVKELWAKIGKHVAAEAGIKARTPKDEMLEALAEYFELEPEEEAPKAKAKTKAKSTPVVDDEEFEDEDEEEFDEDDEDFEEDEDEDDIDEDEEDEDDDEIDEDEDDVDEDDEDEEEFDEDEEDFEDDEDEDDDEDDVTEEDVDALFETGNKAAIVVFCKEHGITLPKKKMSAATIKQIIKDELFGDDE